MSQASAQAGNEMSRTAFCTNSMSLGVGLTVTSLNFLPVVQGSWPALQRMASVQSSSEYFQMSSVSDSMAPRSLICCSEDIFFQEVMLIA